MLHPERRPAGRSERRTVGGRPAGRRVDKGSLGKQPPNSRFRDSLRLDSGQPPGQPHLYPATHTGADGVYLDRRLIGMVLFAGRGLLASLFVLGGLAKIASPELYLEMMATTALAPASGWLNLVIVLELGGGLWLAGGLRGYAFAAFALAAHTLLINLFLHPFWELDGIERITEISFFFKNVSIIGGLLLVAGIGFAGLDRFPPPVSTPESPPGPLPGALPRALPGPRSGPPPGQSPTPPPGER